MINSTKLKRFITGSLIITASQFITVSASATGSIFNALANGTTVKSCQSCHNGASGSESKGNLIKPTYSAAFNLDKTGLTRLKNVINGCTGGQTLNSSTFVCTATPVVTPPAVTPPAVTPPAVTPPVVTPPVVTTPVVTPPVVTTNVIPGPTNADDDDNDDEDEDDHDSNHHGKSDKHQKHHTHSGSVGKNSSGAAKTDSYEVTCAKGTKSLAVSVMDLNPPKDPLISIQAFKGRRSSPLSIDKIDGDANYSRSETLSAGAGTYTINVNKGSSKVKGSEAYTAKFSCQNTKGSATSSKLKKLKDQ
jgi:hypothetical protein